MVFYRRNFLPGGKYFFTVTLKDRKQDLLVRYFEEFKDAYDIAKMRFPFKTLAYVILPEHCHVIWQLPEDDSNYSARWLEIKKSFTKKLLNRGVRLRKNKHNEYSLWQRRYWEHTIQNDKDFEAHVYYIHYNPIKHGLVKALK